MEKPAIWEAIAGTDGDSIAIDGKALSVGGTGRSKPRLYKVGIANGAAAVVLNLKPAIWEAIAGTGWQTIDPGKHLWKSTVYTRERLYRS